MVSGVGAAERVQNIYPYSNSHYNQIDNEAVLPVTGVEPVLKLVGEEDELKFGVTYGQDTKAVSDERAAWKEKEALAESYREQKVVSYNLANPYEAARKNIEGSLLLGMNFDQMI